MFQQPMANSRFDLKDHGRQDFVSCCVGCLCLCVDLHLTFLARLCKIVQDRIQSYLISEIIILASSNWQQSD